MNAAAGTRSVETLVLGAGLAGLATGHVLARRGRPFLIVERERELGGLCRSIVRDGFAFDLTGHVLHMRTDRVRDLVRELLPDTFARVARRARIASHGVLVPYPFQVNLAPLPVEVQKECLLGFFAARARREGPIDATAVSFEEWIRGTFGEGIARHFMIPYNAKMWGVPLSEMSAEWTSWSVPVPTLEEVVDGALGHSDKAFGYNPEFLYPKTGGIEVLPRALARGLSVEHDELCAVDLEAKLATFSSGAQIAYARLVSTLPLPELLRRASGLDPAVAAGGARLRHVSVIVFNLGVDRAGCSDAHWIYYADPEIPFYRVGFPSSFSAGVAPPGTSSMYVEISAAAVPADLGPLRGAVMGALERVGLLRPRDRIVCEEVVVIPHGYVIYDVARREALPAIWRELARHDVYSTGRYGAWEYGSMETAIAQGLAAGESIP
ncbi:MAG: NAD(P)-binding protein [Acidobacteriota bacterium]